MPTTNPIRDRSTEKTFLIVGLLPSPARAAAGQGSTKKKGTNDREGNGLSRRRSPLDDHYSADI